VFLRTVAIPWQIEQVAGPALVFYGKTIVNPSFDGKIDEQCLFNQETWRSIFDGSLTINN